MSIIYLLLAFCMSSYINASLIILDPAGDAKQTGRSIGETFERAITYRCAQELQQELHALCPSYVIELTREAGQEIKPLQNASFSNKLNPTLYVNICACAQHKDRAKPNITIYHLSLNDAFITRSHDLAFIPVDEAHRTHQNDSATYAKELFSQLDRYQTLFSAQGTYALPLQSLIGIQAPALCLELGLIESQDWKLLIKPLAASIAAILQFS